MQKFHLLKFTFAILFILFSYIHCQSIPIQRILESNNDDVNSPNDGHVSLANSPRFAVSVDLDYNETTRSAKQAVNMLLSLHTSTSMLSSGCIGFDSFSVVQHAARMRNDGTKIYYLNFKAEGAYLNLSLWLDYSHWNLSANSILGSNCFATGVNFTRTGLVGMLGLGFSGDSIRNFMGKNPEFAISIEQDGSKGELSFIVDKEKTANKPNVSLSTTQDWRVQNVRRIGLSKSKLNSQISGLDVDYDLIFDLNSDAIGLPSPAFSIIMEVFRELEKVKDCTDDLFRPTCQLSSSKISDFPTFMIVIGRSVIYLDPEVYIYNGNTTKSIKTAIMNFKSISSRLSGKNYVTPEFDNTIVLDSQVLRYHYTVFSRDSSQNTGVISLYQTNRDILEAEESFFTWGLVIKSLLVIVAAIVLIFVVRRCIQRRSNSEDEDTSYQDGIGVSLVVKHKMRKSTKGSLKSSKASLKSSKTSLKSSKASLK